jgi:hypothetical protein
MIQRAVGPVAPLRGDRVPSPVWIVHDNSRLGGAWALYQPVASPRSVRCLEARIKPGHAANSQG